MKKQTIIGNACTFLRLVVPAALLFGTVSGRPDGEISFSGLKDYNHLITNAKYQWIIFRVDGFDDFDVLTENSQASVFTKANADDTLTAAQVKTLMKNVWEDLIDRLPDYQPRYVVFNQLYKKTGGQNTQIKTFLINWMPKGADRHEIRLYKAVKGGLCLKGNLYEVNLESKSACALDKLYAMLDL